MPGMYLNFPFDEELFYMLWQTVPDLTLTALFDSGAVQENAVIRQMIASGSDVYTFPFYNLIGGNPENYDGETNITVDDTSGTSQSGIVFGRAHGWKGQDFVVDFNSGANPMQQIASQVARYWQKQRQSILLKILSGVFSTTDNTGGYQAKWKKHTTNLVVTTDTKPTAENKMGPTTVGDAIQQAVGDNLDVFSLAIMHSKVATNLAGLQLLTFRKYTDPSGIERQLKIADFNGLTVIIDDGVPAKANAQAGSSKGVMDYTTYLFGLGAIQHAAAPVKTPVETHREPLEKGGYDALITRLRETLHPNGFTFKVPASSYTHSPTDAQLAAAANWIIAADPKSIAMAQIITNG